MSRAIVFLFAVVVLGPARPAAGQFTPDPKAAAESLEQLKKVVTDPELIGALEDIKAGVDGLQAGDFGTAEAAMKRSLAVFEKRFPDTPFVGMVNGLLAVVYVGAGDPVRAEPRAKLFLASAREVARGGVVTVRLAGLNLAVDIPADQRTLTLGLALNVMGMLLERRGDYAQAEGVYREALGVWEKQFPKAAFPNGHFAVVGTRANLAKVAALRGDYDAGEKYAAEAIGELKGYLDGTVAGVPGLDANAAAAAMGTLAAIKRLRGTPDDIRTAEQLERQANHIHGQLFPPGHPHAATMTHHRATGHYVRGEFGEARRLLADARAAFEKNFPGGHPDLCQTIRDQGYVAASAGDLGKAKEYSREALAMADRLFPLAAYPDGTPVSADCLNQLGFLTLRDPGGAGAAARYFREAARATARHVTTQSQLLSEADTQNLLRRHLPDALSGLLTATAGGPFDPRDYQVVWAAKGATMRALEVRRRALLASADPAARELEHKLEVARAELSAKLLTPTRPGAAPDPGAAALAALAAEKELLERQLNEKLGLAATPPGRPTSHPFELAERLPEHAAFVDFVRYHKAAGPAGVPGLTDPPADPYYAAFVVARGRRPERVELGPAGPIDEAVRTWRWAIETAGADERGLAGDVHRLFWKPVADRLPARLDALYLSPDAALNQIPFAALPGRAADVLLEETTVVVVPHGPFLRDRLADPPPPPAPGRRMVLVAGVDYGPPAPGAVSWGRLDGSAGEGDRIAELAGPAGVAVDRLGGPAATTAAVLARLPGAQYAHLSTHGFFASEKAQTKFGLAPAAFRPGPRDLRTPGARNPLVLSGLVFAGANRPPPEADPDLGILTAEQIAGKRLAGMDLAVLSACETGLGTEIAGEGVLGLQRAFHLAGCRTVVASLWEVPDAATRELMRAFYRSLWAGAPPAAALRAAQLEMYRRPQGEIDGFGRARRALRVVPARAPPPPAPAAGRRIDANTHYWAAFVASGGP